MIDDVRWFSKMTGNVLCRKYVCDFAPTFLAREGDDFGPINSSPKS